MDNSVRARIVRIGNSRGIRIPKVWLDQLNLDDEVELTIHDDSLVVRPAHSAREGWSSAFQEMALHQDDSLIDQPRSTEWDREEWQW
jgi:antitoxin MazE